MFNKKDKALIQFADGKQAQLGTTMIKGTRSNCGD